MIWWGVYREPGFAWRVIDAASAFREERILREMGWEEASACVSQDRGWSWVRVPETSTIRPDPRPPRRPTQRRLIGPGLPGGGKWWGRALSVGMRLVKSGALATFKPNRNG